MPNLKTKIGKTELKNPVLLASGTCGVCAKEFEPYYDISKLGGIVSKSLSLHPRIGNPTPRVVEIKPNLGMLNSIGLQNPGIDSFLENDLPYLKGKNATAILNVVGESMDDYLGVIDKIKNLKEITAIELNLSCPNVDGGLDFSQDDKKTYSLVSEVKKLTSIPIWAKLSPNITDITLIAKACINAGAEGLSLINTVIGVAIDIKNQKPYLPRVKGGYSGPAIKPIALRMVYEVRKKFRDISIIGIGGIRSSEDAVEFLLCGANAVQVGTSNFINPLSGLDIISGIERYLEEYKIKSVEDIIGMAFCEKAFTG